MCKVSIGHCLLPNTIEDKYEKAFNENRGGIESFIRKHLICHYSPIKQGATNEGLAADPRLVDLSGNGYDLSLKGFKYTATSGIAEDGSLLFSGVAEEGAETFENVPALNDFTAIVHYRGYGNWAGGALHYNVVKKDGINGSPTFLMRMGDGESLTVFGTKQDVTNAINTISEYMSLSPESIPHGKRI